VNEFETSCKRAFDLPSSKRDLNTFCIALYVIIEFLAVLRNFRGFVSRISLVFVEVVSIAARDEELKISCVHRLSSTSALKESKICA